MQSLSPLVARRTWNGRIRREQELIEYVLTGIIAHVNGTTAALRPAPGLGDERRGRGGGEELAVQPFRSPLSKLQGALHKMYNAAAVKSLRSCADLSQPGSSPATLTEVMPKYRYLYTVTGPPQLSSSNRLQLQTSDYIQMDTHRPYRPTSGLPLHRSVASIYPGPAVISTPTASLLPRSKAPQNPSRLSRIPKPSS